MIDEWPFIKAKIQGKDRALLDSSQEGIEEITLEQLEELRLSIATNPQMIAMRKLAEFSSGNSEFEEEAHMLKDCMNQLENEEMLGITSSSRKGKLRNLAMYWFFRTY